MVRALALKRRRDLRRRRWQYLAAGVTLFLGVALFASSYDAYRNLDSSYRRTYARLAFADITVADAAPGFAASVRRLNGVAEVTERRTADVPMRVKGESTFIGRLVGVPTGEQPSVDKLDITDGEYLPVVSEDDALAEQHMAEHFGLGPDDAVRYSDGFRWRGVSLVGVAISPEYVWAARSAQDPITDPDQFGVLFVPEAILEALPGQLAQRQTLVLYARGADAAALDRRIEALARKYGASSAVVQADQPSNKALQLDVLGFRQMAVAFPVMFLLAAGMAAYTLLTRLVHTEREVIGTLRANGLTRGAVERHYLSYGLALGGSAGVLGVAAGVPLGWAMTAAYTAELGIPDTIRSLHAVTPVVGVAFGVAAGVLAALMPARAAAKVEPAEAMRGDVPIGGGHRSLAERLVPPLRRLPIRWRMTLRGIGRNKRRSASTALGVVLALVLVLASWGIIDTTRILLRRQFQQIALQDATLTYEVPVTAEEVRRVGGIDGVARAERVDVLGVSVRGPSGTYSTQLMAFRRGTRMHGFTAGELPGEGVVLGRSLREKVGADVGDRISLSVAGMDTKLRVKVAGFVEEPLGTFAYMRQSVLADALEGADPPAPARALESPGAAVVMARFDPGAAPSSVIGRLEKLPGVAAVSDSRVLYRQVQQVMGLLYVLVGLMLAFGSVMAFALVFNTMSVNLAERAGELATMRANGLPKRSAAALLVGENMLLTVLAIPPGLLAGYVAAAAMMRSYSSDAFDFTLHMYPSTFVWASLAMIGVAALSLVPGVRAAGRMDVAEVVRQRAV